MTNERKKFITVSRVKHPLLIRDTRRIKMKLIKSLYQRSLETPASPVCMLYEITVVSLDFEVMLLILVTASRHYQFIFPSLLKLREPGTVHVIVSREGGCLQFGNFLLLSRKFRELTDVCEPQKETRS